MRSRLNNGVLAPTVFLACGVLIASAHSLFAQQQPPPGGGFGGMGHHRRGGGGGGQFDPVVFQGPPAPDSMAALVQLDDNARQHYATLYENLMSSTQPERDSLTAMREARRAEMAQGNGPSGRGGGMWAGAGIRQDLERKQKEFDKALGDFFTQDQLKRYAKWRDQRRKEAREWMRSPGT